MSEQRFPKPDKRRKGPRHTLKHRASKTRKDRQAHYRALRMEFLKKVRWCQVGLCLRSEKGSDGVSRVYLNRATQVHHKRGRGRWLLDDKTFLAVCDGCHRHIHDNPAWAMQQGYMESRRRR